MKMLFFSFALMVCAVAPATESGPITSELKSAGPTIAIQETEWAKAYEKIENLTLKKISRGDEIFTALNDFDFDVARHAAEFVDRNLLHLTRTGGLDESHVGRVKEFIPTWALPIYDYTEGVPESRSLGNIGKVVQPYEKVNDELRDGMPDSPETKNWVSKMREALKHLPRFDGLSFRGTRLTQEQIKKFYPAGGRALDSAFVSTSMKPEIASRFALAQYNLTDEEYQKIGIIFVIKGRTGRPVSTLADDHDDEAEILFANGTPFKVVAKSPLFKISEILGRYQIISLSEEIL